ncbi:MAG: O-antigen ligase family protein, partial [Armatimonadota bacterium]
HLLVCIAIAASAVLAAVYPPIGLVIGLGAVGFMVVLWLTLARPAVGLGLLFVAIPWARFGLQTSVIRVSPSNLLLVLLLASLTLRLAVGAQRPRLHATHFALAVLVAASIMSCAGAADVRQALRMQTTMVGCALTYTVALWVPRNQRDVGLVSQIVGCACVVAAAIGVLQAVLYRVSGTQLPLGYTHLHLGLSKLAWPRVTGPSNDPNQFAIYLLPGLGVMAHQALSASSKRLCNWALLGCAVLVAGLVLSYSRGGWLGGLICLGILAALRWGRSASRLWFGIALALLLAPVAWPLARSTYDMTVGLNIASAEEHVLGWRHAVAVMRGHWLLGVGGTSTYQALAGSSALSVSAGREAYPHSSVLSLLLASGVLGVTAWSIWLWVVLRSGLRGVRSGQGANAGLFAGCVGMLVASLFFDAWVFPYMWFIPGLVHASAVLSVGRRAPTGDEGNGDGSGATRDASAARAGVSARSS